jgi:serine/threonine protein kinase
MHDYEITHGDLKLKNAMYSHDNSVVIIDPLEAGNNTLGGTPSKRPPENNPSRFNNSGTTISEEDPKVEGTAFVADRYGLGVMAFELFLDREWRGYMYYNKDEYQTYLNKSLNTPNLDKDAQDLLKDMLAYEPTKRIGLNEFIKRLDLLEVDKNP